MMIRVRYAPSPTGYLHIGGARTAIFNYLFVRHYNGKFIVRIEDTDLERNIADGISSQLNNLRWLGLTIDETIDQPGEYGPYQQTKRLEIYQHYAQKLIAENHAYYCFCSPETLEKMKGAEKNNFQYDGRCAKLSSTEIKKNLAAKMVFVIRLKSLRNHIFKIDDIVRKVVTFNSKDIDDFIIIKSNGVATYNFAVTIDDYLMKITHVFRGEEHLSNTPKQLLIYHYFNWLPPKFGHLTLIVNQAGKKLSKRDGSLMQFIEQYKNQGFLPEALFNFLCLLGWHPHEEREIYQQAELIKIFNSEYFSKAPSMFDVTKLLWMNNHYIKQLTQDQYLTFVNSFLSKEHKAKKHDRQWWDELLLIYQKQLLYGAEINQLITLFFEEKQNLSAPASDFLQTNKENAQKVIANFKTQISNIEHWDEAEIEKAIKQVKSVTKISGKLLFMSIRIACSWDHQGPELAKTIKLLGKNKVLARLKALRTLGLINEKS